MPRIVATGTASPPLSLEQAHAQRWLERLYAGRRELPALLRMAEGGGVRRRQVVLPPERLVEPRPFAARNAEYAAFALPLAEQAARAALARAALDARAVDWLITTSCTGLMIPALASFLVPRLGLRPDAVRLPVTELGCAAGAAALARAADACRAHPTATVLVVAVELCSLTFRVADTAMANLVSATLFGDGAAAAVVRGDEAPCRQLDGYQGPGGRRQLDGDRGSEGSGQLDGDRVDAGSRQQDRDQGNEGSEQLDGYQVRRSPGAVEIVASASHLFADSAGLMGFDVDDGGLRIVLAREVPAFLRGRVRPLVEPFCAAHGVALSSLRFAAIHPGGRRILEGLAEELELPPALTAPGREVLAEHGNMSSATVLFVLDRVLSGAPPPRGSHGLLLAFGPGFAAEMSLLRWRGSDEEGG